VIFTTLTRSHDRRGFDCGKETVNRYLRESARQQAEKGLALTFVMLQTETSRDIIGFYTLVMSSVACSVVPEKGLPPQHTAPVVLLAQFGVDRRHQGKGHGKRLLYHALYQALKASEHVGCLAVVLDAVDGQAREFYTARGFRELQDDPFHLWIPIRVIRDMFTAEEGPEHDQPE
jgi:GNAT superfamily N-acetyltransferase